MLHELHRHDFTIFKAESATSNARIPASNATIDIFREGATAQDSGAETGSGATITVHDPGSIVAGDAVILSSALTSLRIVTAITSSSITISAAGTGAFAWADGDRVIAINNRPATYTDDQGTEQTTVLSQVTTDSLGEAYCYTRTAHVEALVTDGSTTTLLQDLTGVGGRYEVAPADWGATFDGSTDDAPYFADALEYLKAKGGGILRLPPGTTRLGSTITLSAMSNIQIIGAGRGITTVQINHAGTGFDLTGTAEDISFSDMTIQRLTGSGDDIQIALGISRTSIRSMVFKNGGIGVDDHGTDTRIRDVWMTGTGWTSFVRLDTSSRCQIDSLVADPAGNWTRGIDIDTGTVSARITNLDIEPTGAFAGIGVQVRDSAAGVDPTDIVITEPHLECGTTGNCIEIDAVTGFRLNGGTLLDSSRGVVIDGGVSIKLIGTNIVGMQHEAVDINGGSHVRLVELDCSDNDIAGGAAGEIDVAANLNDISALGYTIGDYWRGSGTGADYGMVVASGTSTRIQILAGRSDNPAVLAANNQSTDQTGDVSHIMGPDVGVIHSAGPLSGSFGVGTKTMTGAETTTSVRNIYLLVLNQSGSTVWTDLTNRTAGQQLTIVNRHATSTATFNDGGNFVLGGNRVLGQGDVLVLQWDGNLAQWCEVSYANN